MNRLKNPTSQRFMNLCAHENSRLCNISAGPRYCTHSKNGTYVGEVFRDFSRTKNKHADEATRPAYDPHILAHTTMCGTGSLKLADAVKKGVNPNNAPAIANAISL